MGLGLGASGLGVIRPKGLRFRRLGLSFKGCVGGRRPPTLTLNETCRTPNPTLLLPGLHSGLVLLMIHDRQVSDVGFRVKD